LSVKPVLLTPALLSRSSAIKLSVSTKKRSAARRISARERVIAYIDGFNLYFGMKSEGYARFFWLDARKLSQRLLKPHQALVAVKYFTSRIRLPREKASLQNKFLEALETLPGLEIFYGNYQINRRICRSCKKTDHVANEKMTDVNIATEMLTDAFLNKFDTALLLSADGDLVTPVDRIAKTVGKRVIAVFPPGRRSFKLESVATAHMVLGRNHLANSQFPLQVRKRNGFILNRPAEWPT
jgi:uncharacterized LabA/DUF88 family protein